MLVIRKTILIIIAAAAAAATAMITALTYERISGSANLDAQELRFLAEQYLFTGILLTIIIVLAFLILILRSRNIDRELNRLIKQEKLNPASAKSGLKRLGTIGSKLELLYRQIDGISEKRGLKISALTNTVEFLTQNINRPIVIIDITGKIIQVSRGCLEKTGTSRSELIDRDISSLINGVQIQAVLSRLEKKRLPAEFEAGGTRCRWVPLHNKDNEISYIAVILN